MMSAFLFDLDGTLVDSVYQHVLAWREAMHEAGIELAVWRIHRQIGMSGGLMLNALLRGNRAPLSQGKAQRIQRDGVPGRKSTRLKSRHSQNSYAVFCLKK